MEHVPKLIWIIVHLTAPRARACHMRRGKWAVKKLWLFYGGFQSWKMTAMKIRPLEANKGSCVGDCIHRCAMATIQWWYDLTRPPLSCPLFLIQGVFFTVLPKRWLSVRVHGKSHRKNSKCQNFLRAWHFVISGRTSKKNHPVCISALSVLATDRHNLRSFLAANSTQNYFLIARMLSFLWHSRQKCRL